MLGSFTRDARPLLLLLLLLCAGGASSSMGSRLVYQLFAEGEAVDDQTGVVVKLSDALDPAAAAAANGSLASFTLCLWFKVATFLSANTLLTYNISNTTDTVLELLPLQNGLKVRYHGKLKQHSIVLRPLWWYSACVMVEPGALGTWVSGREDWINHTTGALPLNASLLLAQGRVNHDGESSGLQGFKGHMTDLNLWPLVLKPKELLAWSGCQNVEAAPLLAWDDLASVVVTNDPGHVTTHTGGPCGQEGPTGAKMLLFTNKMTWAEARAFLQTNGLAMVAPRSPAEQQEVTDLLARYRRYCQHQQVSSVWLGLTVNTTTGSLRDTQGVDVVNITPTWNPKLRDWSRCGSRCFVYVSTEGLWYMEGPKHRSCSVGVYTQPPPIFKLRVNTTAEEGESYAYHDFILASAASEDSNKGTVYFHGFQDHRIASDLNSNKWFLTRGSRTVAWVQWPTLPLGPREWHVMEGWGLDNGEEKESRMILTLSTCSPSEYTCLNASCIPVSKVCDFQMDCVEGEDERGCFTAVLGPGYNPDIPPRIPLPFLVVVKVRRIANIDLMNSAIRLDLEAITSWRDDRVEYRHLPLMPMKVFLREGSMWSPQLQVYDSLSPDSEAVDKTLLVSQEEAGRLVPGGESTSRILETRYYSFTGAGNPVSQLQGLQATTHCRFDLRRYPADQQTCNITIQMCNMRPDGLIIHPSSRVRQCPSQLEEYDVRQCQLLFSTIASNFTVQVTLMRRREHHIWTTYLPSAFILVIGYGTLFLPAELFNERGFMSLTTLLVFISLYTDTTSSLPHTAYIKHVDVWFVFSIVYLSLIVTTHLATSSAALPQHLPDLRSDVVQVQPAGLTRAKVKRPPQLRSCGPPVDLILKTAKLVFGAASLAFFTCYFSFA